MTDPLFAAILLLLVTMVTVVILFQRLHIPSSLGYLLAGVLLGPHTAGPVIEEGQIRAAAEFGIVFLLFTVGLNFSIPQLHALRHLVLGLGTGQVILTTGVIGLGAWLLGLDPAAAFVVGAVFAQSSTTVLSKQLADQGEEHSRHGRLGVTLSVFQDITTVPLVVIIPTLAGSPDVLALMESLGWVSAKAVLALAAVFVIGRWLLGPLFHLVTRRRSNELFTLTVLLVALGAASITHTLGLSLAFGAFLVGMMLGETEFRHQLEATIRPFRDVLLGLFFVSVGMVFDPSLLPDIWQWAVAGAVALLAVKAILVALLARWAGIDAFTGWRAGLLLAVGGEFGFALLAIALDGGVISPQPAQIALTAVLLSMVAAPLLIRHNQALAAALTSWPTAPATKDVQPEGALVAPPLRDHAIICGYGRIGQNVGRLLEAEQLLYVALDLDPSRVKEARIAGEPVFYGDASERDILEAVGLADAKLVVVSHEDVAAARKLLHHILALRPDLPVMVRTRDESHVDELRRAGATEVVPETLEASLMIASHALLLMKIPLDRVVRRITEQRRSRYLLMREFFRGDTFSEDPDAQEADRLQAVQLSPESHALGLSLAQLELNGVVVTALVRQGRRELAPPPQTRLEADDVLVLFGSPEDLRTAESHLLG